MITCFITLSCYQMMDYSKLYHTLLFFHLQLFYDEEWSKKRRDLIASLPAQGMLSFNIENRHLLYGTMLLYNTIARLPSSFVHDLSYQISKWNKIAYNFFQIFLKMRQVIINPSLLSIQFPFDFIATDYLFWCVLIKTHIYYIEDVQSFI